MKGAHAERLRDLLDALDGAERDEADGLDGASADVAYNRRALRSLAEEAAATADAAEAEVARLRTIVEGRSAPSDAEMREHMDAGGVWLVTEPAVRGLRPTPVTHYVESYARATVLWWTEGARWVAVRDGRPCAWPSPRSEGP